MIRSIGLEDTEALALGAGILGTGGGGNTYIGRLRLDQQLRLSGVPSQIVGAEDLHNDALVVGVGTMGAPTVGIEKIESGTEVARTVRALAAHLKRDFDALVINEIGGSNALEPLICGLQLGLPVVDGDGMGRAFPELQMDTFSIGGVAASPMALGDCHGNIAIFERLNSPLQAEEWARNLTIEMGGSAALVMSVMSGAQLKATLVRDTLTLALSMGRAVLSSRELKDEAPASVIAGLGNGHVLFEGKIVDVERLTVQGFARGRVRLQAFDDPQNMLEIVFQNENLVAWNGDEVLCSVPDLITIVTLEDGTPLGTEMLRYGLRVGVIAMPAVRELKTPAALAVVGPAAFGYEEVSFRPLPGDLLPATS